MELYASSYVACVFKRFTTVKTVLEYKLAYIVRGRTYSGLLIAHQCQPVVFRIANIIIIRV